MKGTGIVALALLSMALVSRSGELRRVKVGEVFELKVGRCAAVEPQGTTLCFDRVVEDSRCPKGAMCVRAGNARISVMVTAPGGSAASLELNTADGPESGVVHGLEIRLLSVDPYPVVHRPVDPKARTARFCITAGKK